MLLEKLIEFTLTFFDALLATFNIRMPASIEATLDLANFQEAVAVCIQLLESLFHKPSTICRQLAYESSQEFLKDDSAVVVAIEDFE